MLTKMIVLVCYCAVNVSNITTIDGTVARWHSGTYVNYIYGNNNNKIIV